MENSASYRQVILYTGNIILFFVLLGCGQNSKINTTETENAIVIATEYYTVKIQKKGFRYGFKHPDGKAIVEAHPVSGLQISRSNKPLSNIESTKLIDNSDQQVSLLVTTADGIEAVVTLRLLSHSLKLKIDPQKKGKYNIMARTTGLSPSYGLGDHAAFGSGEW